MFAIMYNKAAEHSSQSPAEFLKQSDPSLHWDFVIVVNKRQLSKQANKPTEPELQIAF